jgi:hypothetical protein
MPVAVPEGSGLGSSARSLAVLAVRKSAAPRRDARRHFVLVYRMVIRIWGFRLSWIELCERLDADRGMLSITGAISYMYNIKCII